MTSFLQSLMAHGTLTANTTTSTPGSKWRSSSPPARPRALVSATYVPKSTHLPIHPADKFHHAVQQEISRTTPPSLRNRPRHQPNREPPEPPPTRDCRSLQREGHPHRIVQPAGQHWRTRHECCTGGQDCGEERRERFDCSLELSW